MKNIIKSTFLGIFVITTISTFASRHGIGIRSSLIAIDNQPCTAKSYIRNGLIAMWDGIENFNFGVHRNNLSYWTDIINNKQSNFIGTPIINDNCISCKTPSDGILIQKFNSDDIGTIEVCVACFNNNANQHSIINPIGQATHLKSIIIDIGLSGTGYSCNSTTLPNSNVKFNDYKVPHTVTSIYPNSTSSLMYGDGILSTDKYWDYWMIGGGVINCSTTHPGERGSIADYYSVRIYSRPLTEDEIRHNHEIDKMRFNITSNSSGGGNNILR